MDAKLKGIKSYYRTSCRKLVLLAGQYSNSILLVAGLLLLGGGVSGVSEAQCAGPTGSCATPDFDEYLIKASVGSLFRLIEGAFGALVMVVAGLGAIVASAMGAYRAAVGMLVVAVGAFILRALVSLFFGTDFPEYEV